MQSLENKRPHISSQKIHGEPIGDYQRAGVVGDYQRAGVGGMKVNGDKTKNSDCIS